MGDEPVERKKVLVACKTLFTLRKREIYQMKVKAI
jgi:hypothetical protein